MHEKICSIAGCQKEVVCSGYCGRHYSRKKRHGDPEKGGTAWGSPRYFFDKTAAYTGNDCIAWPYAKRGAGRGAIQWDGATRAVHRVMCEVVNGAPPTEKHHAAHECGNGHLGCITPGHLAWKLPKDNEADKIRHGTKVFKLSDDDVRSIRRMEGTMPQREIAAAFFVSLNTVNRILRGHDKTHVI